nr:clp protease proteolytic subunit [Heptacodium miconioides]
MPVGVPKVPFRIPGDEEASWVDINRLYRQRALFLCQELDSEISNQIIGLMTFLTIEDSTLDQNLLINSPGGSLLYGLSIFDTMDVSLADVRTWGLGIVASMATFLLSGGTITKRFAFPSARVMIHQPGSSYYKSQLGEFCVDTEEMKMMRHYVTRAYVKKTGQPYYVIWYDMDRDWFMTPAETKAYGIVDNLVVL